MKFEYKVVGDNDLAEIDRYDSFYPKSSNRGWLIRINPIDDKTHFSKFRSLFHETLHLIPRIFFKKYVYEKFDKIIDDFRNRYGLI